MDLNSVGGNEQLRRMIIREPVWRDSSSPSHPDSLGEKEGSLLALKEREGGRRQLRQEQRGQEVLLKTGSERSSLELRFSLRALRAAHLSVFIKTKIRPRARFTPRLP